LKPPVRENFPAAGALRVTEILRTSLFL